MELVIQDEVPGLARAPALRLPVAAPTITAAALIRARVELEAERLGGEEASGPAGLSRCLVLPGPVEQQLNGRRGPYGPGTLPRPDEARVERMVAVALDAFRQGSFFLLAGDRQVEALDEEIPLSEATEIVFLRLVPLQGG